MYLLVRTSHFDRRLARFQRAHPELRARVARVLRDLADDPFQPRLQLHPLGCQMAGIHAVRLTQAYRVTMTIKITDREIILLDIGSHDEVYR